MTECRCGHRPQDHIDRCFGQTFCAPPMVLDVGLMTKRCDCPGWRPNTEGPAQG